MDQLFGHHHRVARCVCDPVKLQIGASSVESVLKQVMASDQWAFYQAKGTKGDLYELQKEKLELELKTIEKNASVEKRQGNRYRQKIESYGLQAKRYDKQKEDVMKESNTSKKSEMKLTNAVSSLVSPSYFCRWRSALLCRRLDEKEIHMGRREPGWTPWNCVFCLRISWANVTKVGFKNHSHLIERLIKGCEIALNGLVCFQNRV